MVTRLSAGNLDVRLMDLDKIAGSNGDLPFPVQQANWNDDTIQNLGDDCREDENLVRLEKQERQRIGPPSHGLDQDAATRAGTSSARHDENRFANVDPVLGMVGVNDHSGRRVESAPEAQRFLQDDGTA
jgi:hypothetical protein